MWPSVCTDTPEKVGGGVRHKPPYTLVCVSLLYPWWQLNSNPPGAALQRELIDMMCHASIGHRLDERCFMSLYSHHKVAEGATGRPFAVHARAAAAAATTAVLIRATLIAIHPHDDQPRCCRTCQQELEPNACWLTDCVLSPISASQIHAHQRTHMHTIIPVVADESEKVLRSGAAGIELSLDSPQLIKCIEVFCIIFQSKKESGKY